MGPGYSDVDEILESVSNYEDISDFEYECYSDGIQATGKQCSRGIPDANIRRHQSFPQSQNIKRINSDIHQTRQRKSSEISDFSYSENEDSNTQEISESSQNTLYGNDSEVENHRNHSNERSHPNSRLVRVPRLRHSRSLSSSGFSDVELADYSLGRNHTKCKTNKTNESTEDKSKSSPIRKRRHRRRRRTNQTHPAASESPTDFGISTSDVDENVRSTSGKDEAKEIKKDDGSIIATSNVETENSEKDNGRREETELFDVETMKICGICSAIDYKVTRCELCERTICSSCNDQHFDMHAAELTGRLEKLNELTFSIYKELPQNRLRAKIDDAVGELISASNKALQRACDVYQAASSECNEFIGSLVDSRIKISASTKYLIKRIPFVLFSEDICELQYFQKVYNGVRERLDELAIAITDPRSKEMERLALARTFSPDGPFLGANNLIVSLGNLDCFQSSPEAESNQATSLRNETNSCIQMY